MYDVNTYIFYSTQKYLDALGDLLECLYRRNDCANCEEKAHKGHEMELGREHSTTRENGASLFPAKSSCVNVVRLSWREKNSRNMILNF